MVNTDLSEYDIGFTTYQHIFSIDNNVQVVTRERYNFWMALGDIGGFYDGARLVILLFMAPIASLFYNNDLLKGNFFA